MLKCLAHHFWKINDSFPHSQSVLVMSFPYSTLNDFPFSTKPRSSYLFALHSITQATFPASISQSQPLHHPQTRPCLSFHCIWLSHYSPPSKPTYPLRNNINATSSKRSNSDIQICVLGDFPGGPVIKNLLCNAGDMNSIPGWRTKIPRASEQLSPCTSTTETASH